MMGRTAQRIRIAHDAHVSTGGRYVFYWMTATRRSRHNLALERAVWYARELDKPLVVLEALRAGYPWASDRLHRFVIEGMAHNSAAFAQSSALYHAYLEPEPGAGSGLFAALASDACVVIADDYPGFFLPRMLRAAAARAPVRVEAVDSNGLLPLTAAAGRAFYNAHSFRRFLQRQLGPLLADAPREDPLRDLPPGRLATLAPAIRQRWPALSGPELSRANTELARFPINHEVAPVLDSKGGTAAGLAALERFFATGFARYAEGRNHPDDEASSGLSPWLHFGHLGVWDVIARLCAHERWDGVARGAVRDGSRTGYWGLSGNAEAFLDELVTFRELACNGAATLAGFERYDSLPRWALETLAKHERDPREHLYTLEQLERAETADGLWNAAQRELVHTGRMHNYLRMLWGKKVLEWSESPRAAFERLVHLNNKYALDGRDPNSYAGIAWIFGRYDRPWPPERPVYGTVRGMSSAAARKKLRLSRYEQRWSGRQLSLDGMR